MVTDEETEEKTLLEEDMECRFGAVVVKMGTPLFNSSNFSWRTRSPEAKKFQLKSFLKKESTLIYYSY